MVSAVQNTGRTNYCVWYSLLLNLKLELNDLSDDSEDALLKRITIDFNGKSRTLPKPCDQLLEWKEDLKILPDLNLGHVFAYIWDTNRLQNYKNSNGFQLFEKRPYSQGQIRVDTFIFYYIYYQ